MNPTQRVLPVGNYVYRIIY